MLFNRNSSGVSFVSGILQGYGKTLVLDRGVTYFKWIAQCSYWLHICSIPDFLVAVIGGFLLANYNAQNGTGSLELVTRIFFKFAKVMRKIVIKFGIQNT